MLKQRFNKKKNIFGHKETKNYDMDLRPHVIYRTNNSIISLVKIVNWLKKTYRRFKKRNIKLYLNFQNNIVKTYKSKNARMGKGKGQTKRYLSFHISRVLGSCKHNSKLLNKKLIRAILRNT